MSADHIYVDPNKITTMLAELEKLKKAIPSEMKRTDPQVGQNPTRVWIENDVYAQLKSELEYLRQQSRHADTSKLLKRIQEIHSLSYGKEKL